MDASEIIRALGGPSKLAARLSLPGNTVAYWGHRNRIPAERWLEIWRMAIAAGLDWQPPGAEGLREALCPVPPQPTQPQTSVR